MQTGKISQFLAHVFFEFLQKQRGPVFFASRDPFRNIVISYNFYIFASNEKNPNVQALFPGLL